MSSFVADIRRITQGAKISAANIDCPALREKTEQFLDALEDAAICAENDPAGLERLVAGIGEMKVTLAAALAAGVK